VAVFVAGIALLAAACSTSTKFGLFDHHDGADSLNATSAQNVAFSTTDLAVASASTTVLLEHDGASGPWENPLTGARGTITPLAAVYRDNGIECRDFLASYVRENGEAWMQGEACRNGFGRWEVRNFRPWRR
jgi:surface antigen